MDRPGTHHLEEAPLSPVFFSLLPCLPRFQGPAPVCSPFSSKLGPSLRCSLGPSLLTTATTSLSWGPLCARVPAAPV